MPIRLVTPISEIRSYLEEELKMWRKLCIRNLSYVGEQVLNAARSTNSYKDQTGNLRSSVGFAVIVDGEVVDVSGFEPVRNGQEGSKEGADYARELAKQFPKGIALVVVAGMNYASYVSAKGYDVLDSAELLAERLVPQILGQLGLE